MQETFSHSPRLRGDHFKHTALRLLLWALIGIPFWVFGILMLLRGDGYAGLVFAGVFTAIKGGFEIFYFVASREFLCITRHRIVRDGSRLIEESADRIPLVTIDLERPFTVAFSFSPVGQAVYRVTQDESVLRFSARLNDAERLVKDILGCPAQWPPEVPAPESAAAKYHRQAAPDDGEKR